MYSGAPPLHACATAELAGSVAGTGSLPLRLADAWNGSSVTDSALLGPVLVGLDTSSAATAEGGPARAATSRGSAASHFTVLIPPSVR